MWKKLSWYIIALVGLILSIGIIIALHLCFNGSFATLKPPLKVGVLHSLTGTLSYDEQPLINVTLMAIDEINAQGGVLGRRIEPIVVDGKSDEMVFKQAAEDLITKEHVDVIFGCLSSASRKEVKEVVEKHNILLFYPAQSEGLEESPNIIYTGASPNQALIPGVNWCFKNLGTTFFLVGSDYIFPHAAHEIIKDLLTSIGGTVVGEEYLPLGSHDVTAVIKKINEIKPEVILNTINGDTNIDFFRELRTVGITTEKIPTMSFSLSEPILQHMNVPFMTGDYVALNYVQTIYRPENTAFIAKYKAKYGENQVIGNNMESAYDNVYLWTHAVKQAGNTNIDKVRHFLYLSDSFDGPGSVIYLEQNLHAWREVFIAKIRFDGQFDIIWSSKETIEPMPYPFYKSKKKWDEFLDNLYTRWGNRWTQPTP